MQTLKLTSKDFKDTDNYYKEYIGKVDVSDYEGHIEIEGNLGWVKFVRLLAKGHIWSEAGTGIEAGEGIKAGTGIEAGEGIKAGLSITCKLTLKFAYRLFAGTAVWRDKNNEDKLIQCGKLEGGEVCYGEVKELGLPEEKSDKKVVKIKLKGGEIVEGEVIE